MVMRLYYPAIFIINEDGYTVEFPDLPGCVTQGDTLEEAFEMAEDAASGWILTSIEDNEEVPPPSPAESIDSSVGCVVYIQLDIDMANTMERRTCFRNSLCVEHKTK